MKRPQYPFISVIQSFLIVIVLLQGISSGAAIKCFVCDSTDNPSCADLKSNSSIVPEECTLEKMKSIDTWLFELNKFAYFDTGGNRSPVMYCQKVVARDPNTEKMVTARFCQLDTADSDACSILRTKLRISENSNDYNRNDNRRSQYAQNDESTDDGENEENDEQQFHCSICKTDRCNGSANKHINMKLVMGTLLILTVPIMKCIQMRYQC